MNIVSILNKKFFWYILQIQSFKCHFECIWKGNYHNSWNGHPNRNRNLVTKPVKPSIKWRKREKLKNVQFKKVTFALQSFLKLFMYERAKRKRRKIWFQKTLIYATDDTLFIIALFFPLRWREDNNFDWIFFARKIQEFRCWF